MSTFRELNSSDAHSACRCRHKHPLAGFELCSSYKSLVACRPCQKQTCINMQSTYKLQMIPDDFVRT